MYLNLIFLEILNLFNTAVVLLGVLYAGLVLSFILGWLKLSYFTDTQFVPKTKVSIIVAARNEELLIGQTIDDLLAQNYPKDLVEIIIIDDHSTDSTASIVQGYALAGVKLIQLNLSNRINSYKKMAIQTAIGDCEGDLIVTTDADCRMGKQWLSTIVACYQKNGSKMISSPVAYFEEKNWFERLQALEFLYLIGMGASTIGNKMPSTCNGANLAYEKKTFYEVGGFKGIDDLASGDDELLLHKIAAKYPDKINFLKNRSAIVFTQAKASLSEFIQQRKRWASKSTRYKNKAIIVLGVLIWSFNLMLLLGLAASFFFVEVGHVFLTVFLFKLALEMVFLWFITSFAQRRKLLFLAPILSLVHILYMVYIGIAGNSGQYNWKGRSVK